MVRPTLHDLLWSFVPPWLPPWLTWGTQRRWWLLGGGMAGLLLFGALITRWKKQGSDVYGSAIWATIHDIKAMNMFEDSGVLLGQAYGRDLYAPAEQNVLVLGPPGEGKTAGTVLWTMAQWRGSLLVLDLKGSLLRRTKTIRAQYGPVYVFEPTKPATSDRMNPLDAVHWDRRSQIYETGRLSGHLTKGPVAVSTGEGAHYERIATIVIHAVSLFVGHSTRYDRSIPGMLHCMSSPGKSIPEILEEMDDLGHPVLSQIVGRLQKETAPRLAAEWAAAIEWLTVWDDPDLAQTMSSTTIPWTEMQSQPDPMTIYLRVTADEAKGRLQPVLRLLLDQILAYLTLGDPGQHRHELLVVLDDAAELERLPIIQTIAAFGREFGIRLMVVFQSPMQVWEAYGREASLFNTCGTWVIYRQNDPDPRPSTSQKNSVR